MIGLAFGRRIALHLLAVASVTLMIMAGLLALALASGLTIEAAVSDPHELTRQRFLGVVSNAGVLVWASTVAVCLFTSWLAGSGSSTSNSRRFFLASAAVTMLLLVDDLLLVHEAADDVVAWFVDFDRTRRQKDVLEGAVFAVYGVLFAWYAITHLDTLRSAQHGYFLWAAAGMFAVSVLIDFDMPGAIGIELPDYRDSIDVRSLLEEGSKLVGIAFYGAFFLLQAGRELSSDTGSGVQRGPHLDQ